MFKRLMPGMWIVLVLGVISVEGADPKRLSRADVEGMWSGTGTNGLSCQVRFDKTHGKVFTFREGKHLTTVNFWWNIDRSGTNVVLGVNGHAHAAEGGELQLRLRPVNTNIVTVRDVRLRRVVVEAAKR